MADIDTVAPMYNLLEYSDNYSLGNLWNFHGDEVNDAAKENDTVNNKISNTRQQYLKG